MILRPLADPPRPNLHQTKVRSAWEVFIELEKRAEPPCAIVFQADHSKLAGDLAAALLGASFGELSAEVIQATAQHDFGWNASDEAQMRSLSEAKPRPFPCLTAKETLPSWHAGIAHARTVSPLVEVLVSRHYCVLGAGDPGRAEFVQSENARRARMEKDLPYRREDLDRWTAALGFCDLLSLYLCCGAQAQVEFPLAHPAAPDAKRAPKTVLRFHDGRPRFSPPVFKPATRVSLTSTRYDGTSKDLAPLFLNWSLDSG